MSSIDVHQEEHLNDNVDDAHAQIKLPVMAAVVPALPGKRETTSIKSASTSTHVIEENVGGSTSPLKYRLFGTVVENYCLGFLVVFALELLGVFLSYLFVLQNPDEKLFPLDFKGVPIELKTDSSYRRLLASLYLTSDRGLLPPVEKMIMSAPSANPASSMSVIYQGDNVFTKECLQAIGEVESWLTDSSLWRQVALTDANGEVLKPVSVLRYFDGTYGTYLNDTDLANIPKTLYAVYSNLNVKKDLEKLISRDAAITPTAAESTLTRSVFTIGSVDYPGMKDKSFWEQSFVEKLDQLVVNGKAGMKIYYFNEELLFVDLIHQVEKDIILACGSFAFIVIFVLLQTQSIFITVFGITSIFFSFIWTNYIYRVLLGYKYFGIFHAMSIFIILGIGTDDLFVFYDMWRATACMDLDTDENRFTFCYRHASVSMLITSVTTAVAFVSNVFTPLYGISSFAIFTAILVMINYLSAVLFFPFCVLVYHKHIGWRQWPWQFSSPVSTTEQTKNKQQNLIVKFFKGSFYSFVTHRVVKWVLIVSCTGNGLLFAFFANQLEISEKNIQFYRNGYNYQEATKLVDYGFKRKFTNSHIIINILFGIKEQDMSKCDKHDYECTGSFSYDASLDLNPIPAQMALLKACHMLKNLAGHYDLHLARDEKTKLVNVMCFLDNMNQFFKMHGLTSKTFTSPVNLSLPVSGIKFLSIASLRPDLYAPSISNGNFYRFFETAVSYWLNNAYTGDYVTGANFTDDVELSDQIGLSAFSEDFAPILNREYQYYGAKLRYFIIEIHTTLVDGMTNYKTGLAAHDAWENFTNSWMSWMPPSVQGFQLTFSNAWQRFKMSQTLQESAIRGIILGTILAFCVLTFSTCNVIISSLATLNILLVIVTFAGCIQLFGMKISVIESINLSLVAGLSVDYVVHLSESYNHAPHTDRHRKVRDMLEQMGVSVLSGAISTAGASLFMLHAAVYFFFQFGLFILLTIILSLFYSLLWFTPLLTVIGPEGNVGSLAPVFHWIKSIMQPIREELAAIDAEQRKTSYSKSSTHSIGN